MAPPVIDKPFRLWSIRFSHYVEKVRWTLDHCQVPYRETPLMPILHLGVTPFVIGFSGKADSHSTRFSTPVLQTDRDEKLIKSSNIMRYVDSRFLPSEQSLFPTDEVIELDEYYNRFLGPHTRRLFYIDVLNHPNTIIDLAHRNVPKRQAALFKYLFFTCKRLLVSQLQVTPERVEKGISYIYKEFEKVEKRLSDGRPYLTGDTFTAADISFACLGGAIVLPTQAEGYSAHLPNYSDNCPRLIEISKDFRQSSVGQWVLKLFSENRGQRLLPTYPP